MREVRQEILIFGGTTEGRKLSEYLVEANISHTVCVATEYGENVFDQHSIRKVHRQRMNQEEIQNFLKKGRFAVVVDATHPFAETITHNTKAALENIKKSGIDIPYFRLIRDTVVQQEHGITYFETKEACAKALGNTKGNILLTTGSKELSAYCISKEVKDRLYVRVLPNMESLSSCMQQGIGGKRIIAMQGPFSVEMNEAVIRQCQISYLVTKESGALGGYPQKLEAAKRTGTHVFVITCPKENDGYSFSAICSKLEEMFGTIPRRQDKETEIRYEYGGKQTKRIGTMEIILAGAGMGHFDCLTKEVERAIREADILLGSERLLEHLHPKYEKRPYYQAKQIIPYLQEVQEKNRWMENRKVVVLFSGDSGCYSGAQHLYAALQEEIRRERLWASLRILPGISSVAYLAACIGESYQDAGVYSMHGKKLCSLVRIVQNHPKTFLLTSGLKDIHWIGKLFIECGMPECEVIIGYQLSYEGQRIEKHTPEECCQLKEEGLYTCLIKNPYAIKRKLVHGIADERFTRGGVPMTKEEAREVGICKLRLQEGAVVYDIGSGTGSVAIEIAGISDQIQVYAIEKKEEAISLIEKNKEKFGRYQITTVKAMAPEGLMELPIATHAFIGGSSGRLKEIVQVLRQINPKMRVVIHAVTMETICELQDLLAMDHIPYIRDEEMIQLQVSRAKQAGRYHLMQAENPVWICAFQFTENG